MGAFAPPAAWNKPKAKPPAVDPAVREAPLKALLALGLEKLATAGCDDRCYAATTPGRPLCVLVPGGGSGPTTPTAPKERVDIAASGDEVPRSLFAGFHGGSTV